MYSSVLGTQSAVVTVPDRSWLSCLSTVKRRAMALRPSRAWHSAGYGCTCHLIVQAAEDTFVFGDHQ